MSIVLENTDINEIPVPEYCSLYKAVCWIAFGEKPMVSAYSSLIYNDYRIHRYENLLTGDVEILNDIKYVVEYTLEGVVYHNARFKAEVEKDLVEASHALHIKIFQ